MSIPKYQQIKQDLMYKIKNGEFSPGDKFYTEAELKKIYSVSSITVVKAIRDLESQGYLIRYQGKGTFVSKAKKGKLVRFYDIEVFSNKQESIKVISIIKKSEEDILKELKLSTKDEYYEIKRVRYVDNIPFLVHISYIPIKFIKKDKLNKDNFTSIYERFKEDFGINLFDAESIEINEVCSPSPEEITKLLKLKENEPTIKQIKHSYLFDKSIAEYIVSYKHWKYYKTQIHTLSKN